MTVLSTTTSGISSQPDPLAADSWLQWNEDVWGLRAERVHYVPAGKDRPSLDGVLYLDRQGRVRLPPLNPYLPFAMNSTNTTRVERLSSQWLAVASLFAQNLSQRKTAGPIALPPGFIDARPFQWAGLRVELRYTFIASMPTDLSLTDNSVRKNMRKARDSGYTVGQSNDWSSIMACLKATELRRSFSHGVDELALEHAHELVGENSLHAHLVRNRHGEAASGGVRLLTPGGMAIDWIQGTKEEDLSSGANQMMYDYVLGDLASARVESFNYGGANIARVARAKAAWGFPLVPYLMVSTPGLRNTAINLKRYAKQRSNARTGLSN